MQKKDPVFSTAVDYMQLLLQEGKSDIEAVHITAEMYDLSDQDAHAVLQYLKELRPEVYTSSKISNVKHILINLSFFIIVAAIYFIFADELGGAMGSFSMLIALFFSLIGLLLLLRVVRLAIEYLKTTYPQLKDNILLSNAATPSILVFLVVFSVAFYNYSTGSGNLIPHTWSPMNIVLEQSCYERENTGTYILKAKDVDKSFRWSKPTHLYQFSKLPPDQFLRTGDTLTVWILNSDKREMNKKSTFIGLNETEIYDISKNGIRLLNIEARNAEASLHNYWVMNTSLTILIIASIIWFILHKSQRNKIY